MSNIKGSGIAKRLGLGFGALLAALILLVLLFLGKMVEVSGQFSHVIEYSAPVLEHARELEKLIIDMETGERGFIITGKDEFLEPFDRGLLRFELLMKGDRDFIRDSPGHLAALSEIDQLLKTWIKKAAEPAIAMRREISLEQTGINEPRILLGHPGGGEKKSRRFKEVALLLEEGTGKRILDTIRERFEKLYRAEQKNLVQQYEKALETTRVSKISAIAATLFSILLSGVIALFITRSITGPVGELVKATRSVGTGELPPPLEIKEKDEIGQLAEAFNSMVRDIRESRSRYLGIVENAVDGVITIDMAGMVESFNPAAEKIFAYSSREVVGRNINMLMPSPYNEEHDGYLENYRKSGKKKIIGIGREVVGRRRGGETFPLDLAVSEISVNGRQVFTGVVRDITERREAERALARKSLEMSLLYGATTIASESSTTEEAFQKCLTLVGRESGWPVGHVYKIGETGAELEPTGIWYLEDPQENREFRRVTEQTNFSAGVGLPGRVLAMGREAWIVNVMEDDNFPRGKMVPDIAFRAAFAFPVKISGHVKAVFEFFSTERAEVDQELLETMRRVGEQMGRVFERKEAQTQIRERARLLAVGADLGRAITEQGDIKTLLKSCTEAVSKNLHTAFVGIWLLSEREQVLELEAASGVYPDGKGEHERISVGEGRIGRIAEERKARMTNDLEEVPDINHGELARREGLRAFAGYPLTINGRLLGVAAIFSSHPFPRETLKGLGAGVSQIALGVNRLRVEGDLIVAKETAEEAVKTKAAFLANMSHELRTPLNSIIGFTKQAIKKSGDLIPERQLNNLHTVHRNGQHLLGLINSLLDLSKIEAGKMDVYAEAFDTNSLIRDVLDLTHTLSSDKGLEVTTELPEESIPLNTDKMKLKQILINLFSNAVKFTKEGGIITVGVRVAEKSEGEDFFKPDTTYIAIDVTDTGAGMSSDELEIIFEAFRQVDGSYTRRAEGTGLGLAISREFTELLQGRVGVKSEVGRGSTFTVTLPTRLAKPSLPEILPPEGTPAPEGGKTILCIDDDPEALTLLSDFLIEEGYQVVTALSGEEGLRKARQLKPFAITLDIQMPVKDGWTVMNELKNDDSTRNIPIIIATTMDNRSLAYKLGAVDYLQKPISQESLKMTIERLLPEGERSILIVDDNPDVRSLLMESLESEKFKTKSAENGVKALEALKEEVPDLVLLDLMMPEMDGFEVIRHLKSNPDWTHIPVIVITAKTISYDERLFLEKSIQTLLPKESISSEALLNEISKNLKVLQSK